MGALTIPVIPSDLNSGAYFTSSGSWTVPSGVTYAVVIVRGGDGTVASSPGVPTANTTSTTTGTAGGDSSVLGVIGSGGAAGTRSHRAGSDNQNSFGCGAGPGSGSLSHAIVSTTPGAVQTVTVGAGVGAFVSIMWRA